MSFTMIVYIRVCVIFNTVKTIKITDYGHIILYSSSHSICIFRQQDEMGQENNE